jgi:hypothetical protein
LDEDDYAVGLLIARPKTFSVRKNEGMEHPFMTRRGVLWRLTDMNQVRNESAIKKTASKRFLADAEVVDE